MDSMTEQDIVSPRIADKMKDPGFAAQRTRMLDGAARGSVMLTGLVRAQYGITSDDVAARRAELHAIEADDVATPSTPDVDALSVTQIDDQLATMEKTIAGMDKRIKDMTFWFINSAAISGQHVTEETRDRAWQAELPNLQAKEQELLNEINAGLRRLQNARQHIDQLDAALDVTGEEYAQAAAIVPMVEREAANLTGEQLAAKLRSVSLRKDRTLSLAWIHAARAWVEKHPSDRNRGEVTNVVSGIEQGFRGTQSTALQAKYEKVDAAARSVRTRIERARQARGQVPDFLQGVFQDRRAAAGQRVHGYE
ncbi:MAG: hypothetical protein WBA46_05825 [Thermomicrobiales bacterium]